MRLRHSIWYRSLWESLTFNCKNGSQSSMLRSVASLGVSQASVSLFEPSEESLCWELCPKAGDGTGDGTRQWHGQWRWHTAMAMVMAQAMAMSHNDGTQRWLGAILLPAHPVPVLPAPAVPGTLVLPEHEPAAASFNFCIIWLIYLILLSSQVLWNSANWSIH